MKVDGSNANTGLQTKKTESLSDWLDKYKNAIGEIIPANTVNVDRFMQSAKLAIFNSKAPLLAKCTPESIYRSLKEAASYGFELGGVLGQAYLIPYNESFPNGNGGYEKRMTCHFQMGYKGLIALARRSKTIKTIACEAIHENDIVDIQLGCNRTLKHTFDFKKPRGKVIGYYCLVELTNGGIQFDIENVEQIEEHRDKFSKMYKKEDKENNWNKNFDAMALKTCVIQALKLCPISVEELEAVRLEELKEAEPELRNVTPSTENVIDAEVLTVTEKNKANSKSKTENTTEQASEFGKETDEFLDNLFEV